MCGIAGIVGHLATKKIIINLLEPIGYRGEEKYLYEHLIAEGIAFGTNRLAITDEANGEQPKASSDKKVICVMNGEIYNHNELRNELRDHYHFSSESDTEVALAAYLFWGENFVAHIEGQFGIAIYDAREKKLLLARDRIGIKPLFYADYNGSIVFASEAKAILSLDQTLDIQELPPGSVWQNHKIKSYFKLKPFAKRETSSKNLNQHALKLRELLENAVRKRIPNISKVACMLSGGIDSSLICYLASLIVPEVNAYTLVAPGKVTEDLKNAIALCEQYGINHTLVTPSVDEMQQFYLNEGAYMTESYEPILVRNAVSFYFVSKKIAEDGFKFCFSGEGADELFGGYDFIREVPDHKQDDLIWHTLSIIDRTYLQMSDRSAMRATLESRVPYLDKDLVEFALSLPPEARLSKDKNKLVLREAFKNEVPDFITDKKKLGMNEGAGYGANTSNESIYYQAVKAFYENHPDQLESDLNLCREHQENYSLNTDDLEEVYLFSQYANAGFTQLKEHRSRLQLNGNLLPDLAHLKEEMAA